MTRAGETGGILEERAHARRRPAREGRLRCAARSRRDGLPDRSIITFAVIVVLALVAFLVPVFAGVFKEFGGELPLDHARSPSGCRTSSPATGTCSSSAPSAPSSASASWKKSERGREQWDQLPAASPDEDRRHRAEGRPGPLVADLLGAHHAPACRCSQALEITGKTSGNVVVEQAMDDVIERVKQRRHDRRAAQGRARCFPGMVVHMVGVGEETGALDTMLSKIADFYEDQVEAAVKALDLDPRADHDHRRRRDRRLHRHRDVHADVQGLRPDQVATSRSRLTAAGHPASHLPAGTLLPRVERPDDSGVRGLPGDLPRDRARLVPRGPSVDGACDRKLPLRTER